MATRGFENVTLADLGMRALPKQPVRAVSKSQERRSKYRAVKTEVDGMVFDSKREAGRYSELMARGLAGEIRNLELQPAFPIVIRQGFFDIPIAVYKADFRYEELKPRVAGDWCDVWCDRIEDVKGMKTPVYRLKKKLVEAQYGIVIKEIK